MYLSRKLLMFFFSSFVFLNETPNQVVTCATENLVTSSGVIVRSCNNESEKLTSELQFPKSNLSNNTAKEIMTGDTNLNSCGVFLSNQNLSFFADIIYFLRNPVQSRRTFVQCPYGGVDGSITMLEK